MTATARELPKSGPRLTMQLKRHPKLVKAASLVATLLIWEWYGRGVDPIFFSYPSAVLAAIPEMIETGELQDAILTSLGSLAIGFTMSMVGGVSLGLLMGRYRLIDYLLDLQISALYATPNVALIPLLILWFGLGIESKVAIIFLSAFFPIVLSTYAGVRNVSRGWVEVAQVERATERQLFTKVILPASLPFVMSGIRISVGRAVVGMVVAEMFTAISGLGGRIIFYGNQFATDKLLVIIVVLAILGVSLTEAAKFLERRMARWKETERA